MLARKNAHLRDAAIKFYDHFEGREHVYVIDGVVDRPISVTTLIKKNFPEFDTDAVIDRYYDKWQLYGNSKYCGMTKEQIKKSWEDNRVECARLGTEMHKAIEQYLNGELEVEPTTPEFGYFKRFWGEFMAEHPDYEIYRTEWTMYNGKKTVSGSADAIVSTPDGDIILDWKRSKKIDTANDFGETGLGAFSHLSNCNYNHYCIQLNCYKYILEHWYGRKVKGMYFLVFHPDNESYLIYEVPSVQELVAPLLD